jgi:hypothetical protein
VPDGWGKAGEEQRKAAAVPVLCFVSSVQFQFILFFCKKKLMTSREYTQYRNMLLMMRKSNSNNMFVGEWLSGFQSGPPLKFQGQHPKFLFNAGAGIGIFQQDFSFLPSFQLDLNDMHLESHGDTVTHHITTVTEPKKKNIGAL